MKNLLNVPFVSQYSLERDPDGLSRTCGLACIKMILDFKVKDAPTLADLLAESALVRGAYLPGIGWTHAGLTMLLRNHGVSAYAQEFRSVGKDLASGKDMESAYELALIDFGISKIAREIESGRPVLISGIKNWNVAEKIHDMVIIGVEKEGESLKGFYYHDPDDEEKSGEGNFVAIDTFRARWRKFAIFVD